MTTPTFRDIERLSASLDGQLSRADAARLESRLASDPDLRAALDDLRTARGLLRNTPQRRAPRNFTLTPKMAGIRPPVPRSVPALGWASVVATLLFVFTLGTNLVGRMSLGGAAPAMAPMPGMGGGYGGGPAEEVSTEAAMYAEAAEAPAATEAPVDSGYAAAPTATAAAAALQAPAPTAETNAQPEADTRAVEPPPAAAPQPKQPALSPWPFLWLGLAVLLGGLALFVRWGRDRSFARRARRK